MSDNSDEDKVESVKEEIKPDESKEAEVEDSKKVSEESEPLDEVDEAPAEEQDNLEQKSLSLAANKAEPPLQEIETAPNMDAPEQDDAV